MKGEMIEHAFPLIPFQIMSLHNSREKLFYIFKVLRLKRGLLNVNIGSVMDFIKHRQKHELEEMIENDP